MGTGGPLSLVSEVSEVSDFLSAFPRARAFLMVTVFFHTYWIMEIDFH